MERFWYHPSNMALPPQKFREIVFLLLYGYFFVSDEMEETGLMVMQELKVTKKSVLEATAKALAVVDQLTVIDQKITEASPEYTFDRISTVEKTALRLGVFELSSDPLLPQAVAIAEAIRLTIKFGSPEGSNFVNAVLDRIYKQQLASL
jgi:transcription antitermination factor NusB